MQYRTLCLSRLSAARSNVCTNVQAESRRTTRAERDEHLHIRIYLKIILYWQYSDGCSHLLGDTWCHVLGITRHIRDDYRCVVMCVNVHKMEMLGTCERLHSFSVPCNVDAPFHQHNMPRPHIPPVFCYALCVRGWILTRSEHRRYAERRIRNHQRKCAYLWKTGTHCAHCGCVDVEAGMKRCIDKLLFAIMQIKQRHRIFLCVDVCTCINEMQKKYEHTFESYRAARVLSNVHRVTHCVQSVDGYNVLMRGTMVWQQYELH